jgi:hypothetical protein
VAYQWHVARETVGAAVPITAQLCACGTQVEPLIAGHANAHLLVNFLHSSFIYLSQSEMLINFFTNTRIKLTHI